MEEPAMAQAGAPSPIEGIDYGGGCPEPALHDRPSSLPCAASCGLSSFSSPQDRASPRVPSLLNPLSLPNATTLRPHALAQLSTPGLLSTTNLIDAEATDGVSSLHSPGAAAAPTDTPSTVQFSRQAFLSSYITTLLPALSRIHRQPFSGAAALDKRLSAVKVAADMSLVASVGNNNVWSQALLREVTKSSVSRLIFHPWKSLKCCTKPARASLFKRTKLNESCGGLSQLRKRISAGSCPPASASARNSRVSSCGSFCHLTTELSNLEGGFAPCNGAASTKVSRSRRARARACGNALSYLRVLRATRGVNKRPPKTATAEQRQLPCHQHQHQYFHCEHQQSMPVFEEQIESLSGLVPGGRSMDVPLLLKEAADYIVTLEMQIEALQSLSCSLSSF